MTDAVPEARLRELGAALLARDREAHARAVAELAETGDERAIPYLFEVAVIDAIANDWPGFGFPEVLRDRDPPRYLELPEVAWPGVIDALGELATPDYDADHAWIQWETWYSQQDLDLPPGFADWKLRLFKAYLPPVGSLLEAQPRTFELPAVRWGTPTGRSSPRSTPRTSCRRPRRRPISRTTTTSSASRSRARPTPSPGGSSSRTN